MLMYFFFSLYFIVDINHFDRLWLSHELHIFSLHDIIQIKKRIEGKSIYRSAQRDQYSKCFLSDNCDVYSLTAKELKYIPKIILLREFKNYIDQLWDRLPEHIKADSEIQ